MKPKDEECIEIMNQLNNWIGATIERMDDEEVNRLTEKGFNKEHMIKEMKHDLKWDIKGLNRLTAKITTKEGVESCYDLLRFCQHCKGNPIEFIKKMQEKLKSGDVFISLERKHKKMDDKKKPKDNTYLKSSLFLRNLKLMKINFTMMNKDKIILNFHFTTVIGLHQTSIRFETQLIWMGLTYDPVDDHVGYEIERISDGEMTKVLSQLLLVAKKTSFDEITKIKIQNIMMNTQLLFQYPSDYNLFGPKDFATSISSKLIISRNSNCKVTEWYD